jgi:hypothetical protein
MQAFAGHFEEVRIEPRELLDAGDRVVVVGGFAGRAAGGEFDTDSVGLATARRQGRAGGQLHRHGGGPAGAGAMRGARGGDSTALTISA